jgi:hypothetical protein
MNCRYSLEGNLHFPLIFSSVISRVNIKINSFVTFIFDRINQNGRGFKGIIVALFTAQSSLTAA